MDAVGIFSIVLLAVAIALAIAVPGRALWRYLRTGEVPTSGNGSWPPPCDPTDPPEKIATYWDGLYACYLGRNDLPYVPWLPAMAKLQCERGARTVLSLAAGLTLEPYLWADCGLQVTAVDVHDEVLCDRLAMTPEEVKSETEKVWQREWLAPIRDQRKPGGSVAWLQGDFRDPAVAPGTFDIVEISSTLQYYFTPEGGKVVTPEERAIVTALLARVAPGGALLIGNHNGAFVEMRLFDWLIESRLAVGFFRGGDEILWSTKGADPASATAVIFRSSSG